ncbi:MAG TPA: hypothetical protein GX398_02165 [Candidatus Cloacimonetes bacterium]|nr:hypothetical protein [Candidatus Cloacimonadota bacterium]
MGPASWQEGESERRREGEKLTQISGMRVVVVEIRMTLELFDFSTN